MRLRLILVVYGFILFLTGCDMIPEKVNKEEVYVDYLELEEDVEKDVEKDVSIDLKEKEMVEYGFNFFNNLFNEIDLSLKEYDYKIEYVPHETIFNEYKILDINSFIDINLRFDEIYPDGYYKIVFREKNKKYKDYVFLDIEIDAKNNEIIYYKFFRADVYSDELEAYSIPNVKEMMDKYISNVFESKDKKYKEIDEIILSEDKIDFFMHRLYGSEDNIEDVILIGLVPFQSEINIVAKGARAFIEYHKIKNDFIEE